ncbi:MAG TPA: hypothetical protein VHQ20_00155 [Patescibacteria group bacterium]|jgi:hypothetical protein|nr:hypothetical protein [Patescibacteria group bacterium]
MLDTILFIIFIARFFSIIDPILIISIISLIVIIFQLILMTRQTNIMKRQDELLNKKSVLKIFTHYEGGKIYFFVKNHGNKTARDFYWHLSIPKAMVSGDNLNDEVGRIVSVDALFLGEEHYLYKKFFSSPIYPTRSMTLGYLESNLLIDGEYTSFWKIISEDGANPEMDLDYNNLSIKISGAGTPDIIVNLAS